ncbi:MAG: pyridoxal phosphate-dependent aminotransferase [Proteobacteria bacterium]|nr:pyridoxal phosphate-dependent aminotransferase [Pseudomonadota bacterium]MDA1356590.1 pyridoxal phosphate-dependent aminotransferase [Pseudomonadota bacterium]
MQLGKTLAAMPSSGIRDTFNRIMGMPDVINLAPGEPNFPTPPHIVSAASRAIEAGHTKYVSNAGLPELREALCRKLKADNGITVDSDEIVVTHGAMGALYSAFVGLIEPGDEVLLPDPAWPNFTMMATLRSAVIRSYHLTAENGFLPDIDELETLVGPATKLLLINTPLNPIGSVIPRARMAALLDFAAAHDLWIICDEAYEALTYTDSFVSAASLGHRDRLIGVYSFSKTYAMTGWRIGYMVVPRAIAPVLADLQEAMISCASTPGQWAALAALEGPQDVVAEMRKAYSERRQLALDVLSKHGVTAHPPDGAFYLWIDIRGAGVPSRTFADQLLEVDRVAVVPGLDFGPGGEGYVRVSLAAAPEALHEGLERLGKCYTRFATNAGAEMRRAQS